MNQLHGNSLSSTLRRQFVAGMLIVLPLGLTAVILVWAFDVIDNLLQPARIVFVLIQNLRAVCIFFAGEPSLHICFPGGRATQSVG